MKKLISAILALAMMVTMGTTTFASTAPSDGEVVVVNLADDIETSTIREIQENVSSGLTYYDGTVIPVDTVLTIEDAPIPKNRTSGASDSKMYIVTLRAGVKKTDSDSEDRNSGGDTASITLKMTWTDNSGANNVLNSLSTTLSYSGFTVDSGELKYWDGISSMTTGKAINVGNRSSYTTSPNKTMFDPSAVYTVHFEDELFSLWTQVSANVFQ